MTDIRRSAGLSSTFKLLRAAVLLAAAPLLLGAICSGGDDSILPDLEPFTAEQEQRLHEIRDVAAKVRGLDVNEETIEGTLSRSIFRAYIDEEYAKIDDDDKAEIEAFSVALRLFHLIGPDDDIIELVSEDDGTSILGMYLSEEGRLVLITDSGADIDPYNEMILAHEYVHSFQDVAFDSERLHAYIDNDDNDSRTEYDTTISCLKEGDATLTMVLYMEEVYGDDWRDVAFTDDEDEDEEAEAALPPALERYNNFNYIECTRFVTTLYRDGGWEAVNAAYQNPPRTTEQILHPEKFLAREAPRNPAPASIVDTLGEGWSLLDISPFGEFDVYNYLVTILEDELVAAQAAAGWGSGSTAIYVQDQDDIAGDPTVLVHLRLDWDSTVDFLEFLTVFGEVINIVSDGEWEIDQVAVTLQWENTDEYGFVTWNETLNRVDVVISSERQPRDNAMAAQILRR